MIIVKLLSNLIQRIMRTCHQFASFVVVVIIIHLYLLWWKYSAKWKHTL